MDTDLDDTHLCIKCNATIIGIDRYVSHRRRNCVLKTDQVIAAATKPSSSSTITTSTPSPRPLLPQSASPSPGRTQLSTTIESSRSEYDVPYSFHSEPSSASIKEPFSPHHQLPPSLVVSLDGDHHGRDYDYDLGADFFFTSLELQSSSKLRHHHASTVALHTRSPSTTAHMTVASSSASQSGTSDGTAKLMRAVRAISGNRRPLETGYQMLRISQDSPVLFSDKEDDEDEAVDDEDAEDSEAVISSEDEEDDADEEDEDNRHDVPPPSYTKGKWIPGSKIVRLDYKAVTPVRCTGAEQDRYHCRVCDRVLSSRANYEKHLTSDLHRKRSQPEHELDAALRDGSRISRDTNANDAVPQPEQLQTPDVAVATSADPPTIAKRKRRHFYVKCDVCETRLPRHQLGKHLVSQYHYRRMCKLTHPYVQVFKYMPEIVRHSPFQCQPCRFYAISVEHFALHWQSVVHQAKVTNEASGTAFWCSDCKFQCETNDQMSEHLDDDQHRALVETIDRSVPIIIRQMRAIVCPQCGQRFQLNVQLRRHLNSETCAATADGTIADRNIPSTISDQYQSRFRCTVCTIVCSSQRALQHHETKEHSKCAYFCAICRQQFATAQAAREHRSTAEHKVQSQRLRATTSSAAETDAMRLQRKCRCCEAVLTDVVALKEHMRTEHPGDLYCCTTCGLGFALQQELSRHVRDASCFTKTPTEAVPADQQTANYECAECDFTTASQADQLYHELLHRIGTATAPNATDKIPCPRCHKPFTRKSLRQHLRQHTGERLFRCDECDIAFARKANYRAHTQLKHGAERGSSAKRPNADAKQTKPTKEKGPTRPAPKPAAEQALPHVCPHCPFRTRISGHLRRHLAVHSVEKAFACPHCDYRCNNSENLRKHVLSTRIHPGRQMYECDQCSGDSRFGTNFHKELRAHMAEAHGQQ